MDNFFPIDEPDSLSYVAGSNNGADHMFQVFAGSSEAVEAEYSSRADEAFTIAEACDFEVYAVRGFATAKAMRAALVEYRNTETEITVL